MGDVKKKDLHLLANNNSIPKYAFLRAEYLQSTNKHNKNPAKQHKNHILETAANTKFTYKLVNETGRL